MNRRNGFIAVGVGAAIVVLVPFLHNGYITGLMVLIAQNAIAALGLGLLFGTARVRLRSLCSHLHLSVAWVH